MPLLRLESVSYTYKGSNTPALDDVSLVIDSGEYVALVGANGSGKSTLLRLLNGLLRASAGKVSVDGMDASVPANARDIRSTVSLVFQSPPDQIVATVVEEDVAFGPENLGLGRREIERRVTESLEAVGLAAQRRRPPHFLSAGQQQRLAVAGALAMEGRCLVFDEATAMLDPPARAAVLGLMDGLVARGVAVVHATHDMTEALRARRLIAMDGGRVVYDGDPLAFFSEACAEGEGRLPCIVAPPLLRLARRLGLDLSPGDDALTLARRAFTRGADARGALDRGLLPAGLEAGRGRARDAVADPPAAASVSTAAMVGSSTTTTTEAPPPKLPSAPAPAPAFRVDSVSYSYLRGTSNQSLALSGLSLELPRGAVLALVGPTGSGKSTLLQLLDALSFPSEGKVSSFGVDTAAPGADLKTLRTRAPLAIQRPESALFELYAGDDVAFGPRNLGLSGPALVERVRGAMDFVGLPFAEFRDRRTRALSGGEKRLLALAGVLALEPEALLLDEPTAALDPATKRRILELVFSLARGGTTVVLATHSMEEAALADFVGVIVEGRLSAFGPPRRVFYEDYDESWGIGRPFACDFMYALRAAGLQTAEEPLSVDELEELLGDGSAVSSSGPAAAAELRGARL